MAYIKYDVDVNQSVYSDYEGLRKENVGKRLTRKEADTLLDLCGLPSESPKVFALAVKYELLLRHGKTAATYYMVPKEQIPYSRFEGLENDFYNGRLPDRKPKEKKLETTEHETGRVTLDEDYCVNYLKERGYMCFKLTPNLMKMQQVLTPQFLLENMEAELK
ncbi:MAG: hypothetical protein J6M41_08755 [Prevotella sp.]|nr:hypothetical protein [Prevotella sp.]